MHHDPLHFHSGPDEHWTTANLGEALPGVSTALNATLWDDSVDRGIAAGAVGLGAVSAAEARVIGPPGQRLVRFFHGRAAVKVEILGLIGDRLPGTSGEEVARGVFGAVPATLDFAPTPRRYPHVAVRLPRSFAAQPARVRALTADYDRWYAGAFAGDPRVRLRDAALRHERATLTQCVAVLCAVQPAYEAVGQAVAAVGAGDPAVLTAPPGGAEARLIADLYDAATGRIAVADVIARHGFHGPAEGEVSSTVWREDPALVEALIARYAARGEDPRDREAHHAERYRVETERLLAAAGAARRPVVRALLRAAQARIPLRGVAKRAMLQSVDAARAAARELAGDDAFHLTLGELLDPASGREELIAERRAQRAAHAAVRVPEHWRGMPVPVTAAPATPGGVLAGIGVSPGVVEGTVRVVDDPGFADVEDGEVLVAPFTDPSWASIMFVSSALVVDIGGPLSHAAVVARELGIPCVVNTGDGTRRLRTGDRVRVDGSAGTVEVIP